MKRCLRDSTEMYAFLNQAKKALEGFLKADPQANLNQGGNWWIVKPSALSRGRGIHISNTFDDIMHYLCSSDTDFVCQKYIENALLIDHRRVFYE